MKCKNCGGEITESMRFCQTCGEHISQESEKPKVEQLFFDPYNTDTLPKESTKDTDPGFMAKIYRLISKPFGKLSESSKLLILISFGIIVFVFGAVVSRSTSSYKEVFNKNSELTASNEELTAKLENQKKEYSEYKAKMQPYEEIQLTDAKNKADAEKLRIEQENQAKAEREAAEKRAAEEKAAEEERQRAAEIAKGYETGITYNQLARTPNDYIGKKVKFKGKVIQVLEGTTETQIRLAVNGDYDSVLYCSVPKSKTENTRILENDRITIMGISMGLLSYKSTMGGTITIPSVSVDDWGQN